LKTKYSGFSSAFSFKQVVKGIQNIFVAKYFFLNVYYQKLLVIYLLGKPNYLFPQKNRIRYKNVGIFVGKHLGSVKNNRGNSHTPSSKKIVNGLKNVF